MAGIIPTPWNSSADPLETLGIRPTSTHALTRWYAMVLLLFVVVFAPNPSNSGEIRETLPSDWVTMAPGPVADIVQFIQRLPHDPNSLGIRAAHRQDKPYPTSFSGTRFSSVDGTPLAGILGLHRDGKPRPGVVLVPGFTQTRSRKFIVELAELFYRNGWQVLAIDLRGHGESARLSSALITGGWKEAGDVLGAVRFLRARSQTSSVSVIGFSDGGRSLVKAMAGDGGDAIAAGITVTAPLGATTPLTPPPAGFTPSPSDRFFLDFLGARSEYEYYERAARSYGVDLRAMESRTVADADIVRVSAPLLLLYSLDDLLWLGHIKKGQHDGGSLSLAYRDRVQGHPHVRTVLVDRGNHAGLLYLSDPHWFGLAALSYLKYWQARDVDGVTTAVPSLDILAEGSLSGQTASYRFVARNHGPTAVGPVDIVVDLPAGGRLGHCWLGAEGLGRCTASGSRLTWALPRLSGGKTTVGPFGAIVDVSGVKAGTFETSFWMDHPDIQLIGTAHQTVLLEKKLRPGENGGSSRIGSVV